MLFRSMREEGSGRDMDAVEMETSASVGITLEETDKLSVDHAISYYQLNQQVLIALPDKSMA